MTLPCTGSAVEFGQNITTYKKVLLRERKRHTARRVASTPCAALSNPDLVGGGYPVPGPGGYLIQGLGGYPIPGLGGYPIPDPGGTLSQVQEGTPSQVQGDPT